MQRPSQIPRREIRNGSGCSGGSGGQFMLKYTPLRCGDTGCYQRAEGRADRLGLGSGIKYRLALRSSCARRSVLEALCSGPISISTAAAHVHPPHALLLIPDPRLCPVLLPFLILWTSPTCPPHPLEGSFLSFPDSWSPWFPACRIDHSSKTNSPVREKASSKEGQVPFSHGLLYWLPSEGNAHI